jgi:hypothetical protein
MATKSVPLQSLNVFHAQLVPSAHLQVFLLLLQTVLKAFIALERLKQLALKVIIVLRVRLHN